MAGIARKIESFNLAYQLAWKHISEEQKRKQPNIARRLHDSIGRQVKEGATEPVFIASEALKDVDERS
jgi:glucose-6-phosphate-specific signal transduction histidine kinase